MVATGELVRLRQRRDPRCTAELAGHPETLSAPDFDALLDKLREAYQGNGEVDEDDVADESFERDLEEMIAEDAELLRRLARGDA